MMRLLILSSLIYLVSLGAVAYFARPGTRRMMGALGGGVAAGLSLPLLLALAEAQGWWRCPFLNLPHAPLVTFLGFTVSYAPIALVAWRIERRFGWRGTACSLAAVCVLGPPRDYAIATRYPELMVFGPGVAPIAGNAAVYFVTVALTLAVMRLIAGPAAKDRLARS
jgi:hypothetical protein